MTDLYFGSYTTGAHEGDGVTHARYHLDSAKIEVVEHHAEIPNPAYLALSEDGTKLFALGESGWLGTYERLADGKLKLVRKSAVPGGLCHLAILGSHVFAASYGAGELWEITVDPKLLTRYQGSGPNLNRQKGPHAHQAVISPDRKALLVPDLGSDTVWKHRISGEAVGDAEAMKCPPGFGPRHLVYHPSLDRFYVLGELSGTILECSSAGVLREVNSYAGSGNASSAAIKLAGKHVAASHRGDNSLSIHEMNEGGELGAPRRLETGGKGPRDFSFDPDGQHLICAHQHSAEVTVLNLRDGETVGKTRVPSAVCVLFA